MTERSKTSSNSSSSCELWLCDEMDSRRIIILSSSSMLSSIALLMSSSSSIDCPINSRFEFSKASLIRASSSSLSSSSNRETLNALSSCSFAFFSSSFLFLVSSKDFANALSIAAFSLALLWKFFFSSFLLSFIPSVMIRLITLLADREDQFGATTTFESVGCGGSYNTIPDTAFTKKLPLPSVIRNSISRFCRSALMAPLKTGPSGL
mmetsp:Transcript_25792/g.70871  ORF Transcript_25792/g.70871 Transcript_25792/m.70871 type:complete len:208 (+) Transcript_25792:96-719(+)